MSICIAEACFAGCRLEASAGSAGRQPQGKAGLAVAAGMGGMPPAPSAAPAAALPVGFPHQLWKALGAQHPLQLLMEVAMPRLREATLWLTFFKRFVPRH